MGQKECRHTGHRKAPTKDSWASEERWTVPVYTSNSLVNAEADFKQTNKKEQFPAAPMVMFSGSHFSRTTVPIQAITKTSFSHRHPKEKI